MTTVTVSSKGQIAIPARLRRELKLVKSTRLEIRVEKNQLVLRPLREEMWRALRGTLHGAALTAAIEEEHRRERER